MRATNRLRPLRVLHLVAHFATAQIEDELKARTASDITHEEDRAGTEARIAEAYEGQRRNHRFEKRYRHKDARVVWADVSTVFGLRKSGEPLFVLCGCFPAH